VDFRLTDEQRMLSDMVAGLFADRCTSADLRRQLAGGAARDAERWQRIVDMGLPGLMAPEATGGTGLGPVEMALVAVAAGHALLPDPLVEHAGIAIPVLASAGVEASAIERAVAGETIAVGHPSMLLVADADTAATLLLAEGGALHHVAREAVRLDRVESIDPFRRLFRVAWTPRAETRIGGPALLDRMLDHGALFAAAQLLGLAQRAIDLSVAYARDRQQFGKPIGSFQAVKHHLATAQVKVEFARPVLLAAAALLADGSALASPRISHAKLAATGAAEAATHSAVQVHGAMGYSWEVDVHFVLKRALALGQAWGTPAFHRARIAAHVLGAPLGPDQTFGDPFLREAVLEPA
jgi:alkylation response protein AidB-like acyl-CoA dehydrogenase